MSTIFSNSAPKWADEHNDDGEGVIHVLNIDWPAAMGDVVKECLMISQSIGYEVDEASGEFTVNEGAVVVSFNGYEFEIPAQGRAFLSTMSYAFAMQEAIQRGEYDSFADEPPAVA